MEQMNREHTLYFTRRLQLLMADATIARELGCSYATLGRWVSGEGNPPYSKLRDFRELLRDALKELNRKSKGADTAFYSKIADAMSYDDEPDHKNIARPADNPQILRDLITELCWGKQCKSTTIFRKAIELGFTRMQCYTVADKLDVIKSHAKKGRGGYSMWTISKTAWSRRGDKRRAESARHELLNPKRPNRLVRRLI